MGYKGSKDRTPCCRSLPEKDEPLMESEETRSGDSFPLVNETSNPGRAIRHHEVTEFTAMSHVPEVAVAGKEELCFSEDIALLFVMEEQLWGRLPDSRGGEASVEPGRDQADPENWGGFAEGGSDASAREVFVKDSGVPPLNCHREQFTGDDALSGFQSSLASKATLARMIPSPSGRVSRRQGGVPDPAIFHQGLDPCNSSPQIHTKEATITDLFSAQKESDSECFPASHNNLFCHQMSESFQANTDKNHSRELKIQYEMDKSCLQNMGEIWESHEVPSKTEEVEIHATSPTKDTGVKEREVKDAESPLYQLRCEISEERTDLLQSEPNEFIVLPASNRIDTSSDTRNKVEELSPKMLISSIPHFQENEKNTGGCGTQFLEEAMEAKQAENHTDSGKPETAQKNWPKNLESDLATMEQGRQLEDPDLKQEGDLDWKGMENEIRIERELELRHNEREEQNWYLHVTKASGKAAVDETAPSLHAVDIDSHCNLESNLRFSDLIENPPLNKAEEFAFSLKEISLRGLSSESIGTEASGSGEPNSKAPSVARILPEGDSERAEPLIYHDFRQLEYSGTSAHGFLAYPKGKDSKEITEEDNSVGNGGSENAGDEDSAWKVGGEEIASSCRNDLTTLGPHIHLQDSQTLGHSIDTNNTASSPRTRMVAGSSEENGGKGAMDDIESCAEWCKESDSTQKPADQNLYVPCPSGIVAFAKVSELESNVDDQVSSRSDTSLSNDAQGLGSNSLQDLISTSEQSTELSHESSLTALDPISSQTQDPPIYYIEKRDQHVNTSVRNFMCLGREEGSDTFYIGQQSSLDESPSVLDLEKDRAEFDCSPECVASPSDCSETPINVAQSVKPLTPIPVCNETPVSENSYDRLSQHSAIKDCRKPGQFLTHSSNPEAHVQPSSLPVSHMCPSQSLQQLFSPVQTSHFLPKDPQSSTAVFDEESFATPSSSEYNSNQSTPHSVVPVFHASQIRDSTVPDSSLPSFAVNKDIPSSFPAYKKPSSIDNNHFAQKPLETQESGLFNDHMDGDVQMHSDVNSYQTTPNTHETEDLAPATSIESTLEDLSVVELANSQSTPALKDQEDWNIHKASSDSGVGLLDTHSYLDSLEHYPSKSKINKDTDNEVSSSKEARFTVQQPPLLAFSNPMHFLQLGPPSPPTLRQPCRQESLSQEPLWLQQQKENAKMDAEATTAFTATHPAAEDAEILRDGLEKTPVVHHTVEVTKRPPLEKSSSCPSKSVTGLDTKLGFNSKKQEILAKQRAKSKDWHRQRVRKVSVPADNALQVITPLAPLDVEGSAYKKRSEYNDQPKYGEKKPLEAAEKFKRRRSKLISSSKLLYQEYSDVALNKAIQSQKREDALLEDLELESSISQRLQKKDSHLLSASSGSSLWQDMPMVRGSTVLLSMTREEQKLQEAKFELIASEASYLRSLNVAVDHFQHSSELQALLTNQDKQWLFSRLQDVRDVSANFLVDLEEKLEEDMFTFHVCDVALKHAPEFRRVYLPYVTNQTYQDKTFQRLLNGVPAFQQILERLESDPVCQRLSLKSFLILPFQRITRLKLLLQNILKRIPPGADEEVQATQAYDALEKLIKDCNENIQRMKNTEELIYLSQNMEFECKIFPLISQSRRLVKRGELTALEYTPSIRGKLITRPIYLHLFNDYLLLSRPKENGRFIVFDYAAFSDVRGEKCEVKLHGANKNVFRLFLLHNHQGKKVEFLFRTETQSEKLKWISALKPQQAEPDLLNDSDAPQVQCVKPYKPRENDELALEKADIVIALQQSSDGWIEGVKLSDGERGWFPSDQIEFISSRHVRQMNLEEEKRVKNAKQQVFHKK